MKSEEQWNVVKISIQIKCILCVHCGPMANKQIYEVNVLPFIASIGFVKSDMGTMGLCVGYRCASSAFKSGNESFVTHRTHCKQLFVLDRNCGSYLYILGLSVVFSSVKSLAF